jgi:hypothetical protein
MSQQLKLEQFLRTIPAKIETILTALDSNTKLLNNLKEVQSSMNLVIEDQGRRLNRLESRVSNTELSTAIIN